MRSIKTKLAGKAIRSTAKHSAHGTASKLLREPARAMTLLVIGCLAGVIASSLARRIGARVAASRRTPGGE